jgi:DNA-binding response OmpR family regulator
MRVLIVDDEPQLLELAKINLAKMGDFDIVTSSSVEEAFALMEKSPFDAIVSDYQMPIMNGIDFLRLMRERGENIPFILLTGKGREEIAIEALNNGADFYIKKDTDIKSQFSELANALRKCHDHNEALCRLRESQRRLGIALEAASEDYIEWDVTTRTGRTGGDFERLLGYKKGEIDVSFKGLRDRVHPDDLPSVLATSRYFYECDGDPEPIQFRLRHRDGRYR